jgi:hypothetical protein
MSARGTIDFYEIVRPKIFDSGRIEWNHLLRAFLTRSHNDITGRTEQSTPYISGYAA